MISVRWERYDIHKEDYMEKPRLVSESEQQAAGMRGRRILAFLGRGVDGLTRLASLLVSLAAALTCKAHFELAYETTAVGMFALFFAYRHWVMKQSAYASAFPALLVASGALILMPALYGAGVGIVATRGFEQLFLYIVGVACLLFGTFGIRDK